MARNLLNAMSAETVAKIRAKQAAALVLTKQAELIKNMVGEGLLTTQHAEEFLEEIGNDLQRMDKDRNKMYWYVVKYSTVQIAESAFAVFAFLGGFPLLGSSADIFGLLLSPVFGRAGSKARSWPGSGSRCARPSRPT
jgi:polyhydroxyalkanoate synthesis regulator phasin